MTETILARSIVRCVRAAILAAAGVVLLAACPAQGPTAPAAATKPRPAVPVLLAVAQRKTVALTVQGVGNAESPSAVALKSRIDGQITRVLVHDGDVVRRGQVLFEIDARPAQAQLASARAKLASDLALHGRAEAQDRRYRELLAQKFVSPDGYAQYKSTLDSLRAQIDADRAAIESARLQLEYASIRAPIDGQAGRILIAQGNLVKANDTNALVLINQMAPIYVSFAVPEQFLGAARKALNAGAVPVDIGIAAADGAILHVPARLAFIDNTIDPATGTVRLRATVANLDRALWPGQFVRAVVTLGEQADALVVPSDAVVRGPNGPFVFVVDGAGKAQIRLLRIERVAGDQTVVADGLQAGERIVVDGQSRLLPGTEVVERKARSPAE